MPIMPVMPIYPAVEEMMKTTDECRCLAARLKEARELLSDTEKEFQRLEQLDRNYEQSPDYALWKRIQDWLGE